MSLQAALKTLETLREEAEQIAGPPENKLPSPIYDYWAGRRDGLEDAIKELTKTTHPVEGEAFPLLGDQLERDFTRHEEKD